MIISGNEFWDNALDGILIDSALIDPSLAGNRLRNNGRRAEPGRLGAGDPVSYATLSLIDTAAVWLPDGHVGKTVTTDGQRAIVVSNSATELTLAHFRPGASTAWPEGAPPRGAPYRLPDAPNIRAGITLSAATRSPTIRDNRAWDSQPHKTQTHGLHITGRGTCESGRVHDNDLNDNAVAATRLDTAPSGGHWYHNLGLDNHEQT